MVPPRIEPGDEHTGNQDRDDRQRMWKPKFFHNFEGEDSDGHLGVVDVALSTSAAPTYFPSYGGYIDGGVVTKGREGHAD